MDMFEALEALLAADEKRQREEREPETRVEILADEVICRLSGVMRGAYPELTN